MVAAGRLNSQKGFDLLIEAFEPVAEGHPDWQLRIYGGGRVATRCSASSRRAAWTSTSCSWARRATSARRSPRARVFALSSRFEGFGIVVVEAMSKGLAGRLASTARAAPARSSTTAATACSSRRATSPRCRAHCSRLVGDEERRRALGGAALETARRYDPRRSARVWVTLLDELAPRIP